MCLYQWDEMFTYIRECWMTAISEKSIDSCPSSAGDPHEQFGRYPGASLLFFFPREYGIQSTILGSSRTLLEISKKVAHNFKNSSWKTNTKNQEMNTFTIRPSLNLLGFLVEFSLSFSLSKSPQTLNPFRLSRIFAHKMSESNYSPLSLGLDQIFSLTKIYIAPLVDLCVLLHIYIFSFLKLGNS